MPFMGLSKSQTSMLQYEVVSERARLKLTRLLRAAAHDDDQNIELIRQNRFVNLARNVLGQSIYVLTGDGWGDYHPAEHAWHSGEMELIMRRPDTVSLVETLADILQDNDFLLKGINAVLKEDNSSVQFTIGSGGELRATVLPVDKLEEVADDNEHPNIRILVKRMEYALESQDFPGVLHASASVFETLAKSVVGIAGIQDQTLKSFFDRYRKDSKLAEPVLNYILEIYNKRNIEPLAGHGSLSAPTVTADEAVVLSEMTKTFVRIERMLASPQFQRLDVTINAGSAKGSPTEPEPEIE